MGNKCTGDTTIHGLFYLYVIIPNFIETTIEMRVQVSERFQPTVKITNAEDVQHIPIDAFRYVEKNLNTVARYIHWLQMHRQLPTVSGLLSKPLRVQTARDDTDIVTIIIACDVSTDGCSYFWYCIQTSWENPKGRGVVYCTRKTKMNKPNDYDKIEDRLATYITAYKKTQTKSHRSEDVDRPNSARRRSKPHPPPPSTDHTRKPNTITRPSLPLFDKTKRKLTTFLDKIKRFPSLTRNTRPRKVPLINASRNQPR